MNFKIDISDLIVPAIKKVLACGAMEIRDIDEGEEAFLYASGWSGPGYLLIKALVSYEFFKSLLFLTSVKVAAKVPNISFVAGNITGGVIPGFLMSNYLEIIFGRHIPFMYVPGTRDVEEAKKRPVMIINKVMLEKLAYDIVESTLHTFPGINFVAGGAPSGMPLAYRVSEILSSRLSRHVPFVYVRERKKSGGQKELITGIQNNPFFKKGMQALAIGNDTMEHDNKGTQHVINALEKSGFKAISYHEVSIKEPLSEFPPERFAEYEHTLDVSRGSEFLPDSSEGIVVEELSNFAHSARVSATVLEQKYKLYVPNATSILFYDQPQAKKDLKKDGMDMICLITLPELLLTAKQLGTHHGKLIKSYRSYLADPIGWNKERKIQRREKGGTI